MGSPPDLVVRGGTVYDGTGAPGVVADVAVVAGRITEIGRVGPGREEIDATGRIVTPGFVDIHTHYDGQSVWADQLAPSSFHGVTTAVMGNCGVGFAPCKAEDRLSLIELMEGVEDIPAPVMHEGLSWDWESFADYLDVVDRQPRDIDLCALIPHAPLRVYVMGKRALRLEPATVEDVARMRTLVTEGIAAGAFGVSSSRTTNHRSLAGDYTPTLLARQAELTGLMRGIQDAGRGFFEIVTEMGDPDVIGEYQMIRNAVDRSGCSTVFSLLQSTQNATVWRELMTFADEACAAGSPLRPVVAPRPVGMLFGLSATQHPLAGTPTYRSVAHRPLAERVAFMRDPENRRKILAEDPYELSEFAFIRRLSYANMYRLGDPPVYTPSVDDSLEAMASRRGCTAAELAYDLLLEDDGRGFLYVPMANYDGGTMAATEEMLDNPNAIMGLGDGGAHVGFIVDASFPTWLLTYWGKERQRFGVAELVRRLTSDTADVVGLTDRGCLAPGLKADLNVIDYDNLQLLAPFPAHDLPGGGVRLLQRAEGYDATIVSGVVTYRHGEDTGARPGALVRSSS